MQNYETVKEIVGLITLPVLGYLFKSIYDRTTKAVTRDELKEFLGMLQIEIKRLSGAIEHLNKRVDELFLRETK